MFQITAPDQDDHSKDQEKSKELESNDEVRLDEMQKEIETGFIESTSVPEQLRTVAHEDDVAEPEETKKSFLTNATQKTKNLQHKISSQANHLRTKFKRTKKQKPESPKSSPRNSQSSPTERRKFSKLKNIHMPKISKPEFKRPEFTKFKRPDFKINMPEFSKVSGKLGLKRSGSLKETPVSAEGSVETETTATETTATETTATDIPVTETTITEITVIEETPVQKESTKKRFELPSYPKFFDRFRRHSRDESTPESKQDADDESSPPVEFNTIPRVSKATKAKNFIAARFGRKQSEASITDNDNDSGKYQRYNSEGDSVERETSVERRMRVALKNSMEDEEEPLGILQTEEQRQLADYDEENRAIHEISKAREGEFNRRKPLVHQESDLVSEDRDFDWAECEKLREKLVAQHSNDLSGADRSTIPDSDNFHSNLSNEETQSSGSSSHRRRAGVIEEIDDDEFFLRRRGISQDNIEIGQFISSAIRQGLENPPANALGEIDNYQRYFDENYNINNDQDDYGYDEPPTKPKRFNKHFNKSLESEEFNQEQSFDDGNEYYRDRPPRQPKRFDSIEDGEVPVATEYYDDEHGSFYENENMEGIEQPEILVTNLDQDDAEFESRFIDLPLARQATPPTPPKAPKRRKKGRESVGRDAEHSKGRSEPKSFIPNDNNKEV